MTGARATGGGYGASMRFDGGATTLVQMVTINDVEGGGAVMLDVTGSHNIYLEDVVISKCGAIDGIDGGAIHQLGGTLTATRVRAANLFCFLLLRLSVLLLLAAVAM